MESTNWNKNNFGVRNMENSESTVVRRPLVDNTNIISTADLDQVNCSLIFYDQQCKIIENY